MARKHILTLEKFMAQQAAPLNAAFAQWFGKSKVTEAGKPRIVYHGTAHRFDSFHSSYIGQTDDGYYGAGFYFAVEEDYAREYGKFIVQAYLRIENPFILPSTGSSSHESMFDLRDALAALKGGNPALKTNRTIPPGYQIDSEERDHPYHRGKTYTTYWVAPKPELWDDPDAEYGPECESELHAIVRYNDERRGENFDVGWASQLMKQVDRDNFGRILHDNGYVGVIVVDPVSHGGKGRIAEIVVFDPTQIKSIENDGSWDRDDPNMYS